MPAKTTIGPGGVSKPNEDAKDRGEKAMEEADKAAAQKAAAAAKAASDKK
jgi:hypothetical protein